MTDDRLPPPPPPSPTPAPETPSTSTTRSTAHIVAVIAFAAALIGSFLPWFTASAPFLGTLTANGIDGDGKVTAVLSGLGLVLSLLAANKSRNYWIAPAVAGVLTFLVAGYNVQDAMSADDTFGAALASFDVAFGLWIVLVASAVATVTPFHIRRTATTN
jgi:hypothetical protein